MMQAGIDTRLLDLYEEMIGSTDLTEVLLRIARVVGEDFDAERTTIYLLREDTQELESVAVVGNVARSIRVPVSPQSLAGYCASCGRAFVVPDAYGDLSGIHPDLRFDQTWDRRNGFRTRDILCVPAVFREQTLGVIQVINRRGGCFDAAALAGLIPVSRLVAYALYHARLYDELLTLKALRKQKASFMRVMVHELKSPVAGSKMLATGLLYARPGDEAVAHAAARIANRMDELLALVEDILNLSRVQQGGVLSDVLVLDLREETARASEPYVTQAAAKGLTLQRHFPSDPVWARFDRQGYQLVVSNLVSNAVKYTATGSVTVRLLPEDDHRAVLEVRDTGIGIPRADLPSIFQEFFRASNVRGGDIKGTGVGLAGVREIVERFGGAIEMDSEEGRGSRFCVRIPRVSGGSDCPISPAVP
ncbi:MAG: GAF domain-containing sensor histidine kinase [Lentisphaeria bacterium]|nr:GAF domain-containing sensor histidine kinase [Lentisphaeria bacterium]